MVLLFWYVDVHRIKQKILQPCPSYLHIGGIKLASPFLSAINIFRLFQAALLKSYANGDTFMH